MLIFRFIEVTRPWKSVRHKNAEYNRRPIITAFESEEKRAGSEDQFLLAGKF
jgi:hypothetical protein